MSAALSLHRPASGPTRGQLLTIAAAAIVVLNLLDGLFTIGFVQLGAAEEANPLMALPLSHGPLSFMLVKLSLVSLCVSLLWRLRMHRSAGAALYAGATAYSLLLVYHLSSVQHVASYLQR
jgi:hypothetical protein